MRDSNVFVMLRSVSISFETQLRNDLSYNFNHVYLHFRPPSRTSSSASTVSLHEEDHMASPSTTSFSRSRSNPGPNDSRSPQLPQPAPEANQLQGGGFDEAGIRPNVGLGISQKGNYGKISRYIVGKISVKLEMFYANSSF